MKIVFFGTPDYVLPILDALNKRFKLRRDESPITAVVTQKPKPVGRKQLLIYSAVDNWAHKRKIPVYYEVEKLIKDEVRADFGVIASYGSLLPPKLVGYFPHGILVIHPSLLPQFRWGSPIPAAIVTGTNPTGVTIIKMDQKFDHGPIISQFEEEVLPDDTAQTLKERLFEKSAKVLVELISPYLAGKIKTRPQDDSKATFARMLTSKDAFIPPKYLDATLKGQALHDEWEIAFIKDYSLVPSAYSLDRFIRAMDPWPGAWTLLRLSSSGQAKRLKIIKAHLEQINKLTNQQILALDEVQLEGKKPVSWKQFCEAYPNVEFS